MTAPDPPEAPRTGRANTESDDPRAWGLGEAFLGLLLSQVAAAVIGSAILVAGGYDDVDDAPMWVYALLNLPLHLTMAAVAVFAAQTKGRGVIADFDLRFERRDILNGIIVGIFAQLVLVPLVTLPILVLTNTDSEEVGKSAQDLADKATTPVGIIALVLAVGVVAPVVEELFFRGLLLGAFEKRRNAPDLRRAVPARVAPSDREWNRRYGLVASSAIFAVIHFQPILLPALFTAGMSFGYLKQRYGRIGPAMWAHLAFNATTLISVLR